MNDNDTSEQQSQHREQKKRTRKTVLDDKVLIPEIALEQVEEQLETIEEDQREDQDQTREISMEKDGKEEEQSVKVTEQGREGKCSAWINEENQCAAENHYHGEDEEQVNGVHERENDVVPPSDNEGESWGNVAIVLPYLQTNVNCKAVSGSEEAGQSNEFESDNQMEDNAVDGDRDEDYAVDDDRDEDYDVDDDRDEDYDVDDESDEDYVQSQDENEEDDGFMPDVSDKIDVQDKQPVHWTSLVDNTLKEANLMSAQDSDAMVKSNDDTVVMESETSRENETAVTIESKQGHAVESEPQERNLSESDCEFDEGFPGIYVKKIRAGNVKSIKAWAGEWPCLCLPVLLQACDKSSNPSCE